MTSMLHKTICTSSPKDKHYNAILKVKDKQISDLKPTVF